MLLQGTTTCKQSCWRSSRNSSKTWRGLQRMCKRKEYKTFPSSKSKAKGILKIIHSNVCGPISSSSLSRYVYYVSFIDDFSRKTRFTSWRTKMQFSANSRNSKPWSRTTQKKRSRPFDQIMAENSHQKNKELCKESRIKRELSTPYNPQ